MVDIFLPRLDPRKAESRRNRFSKLARTSLGSEYVIHIDETGGQQVLYMKFQDMPENNSADFGLEFGISGPQLHGLAREFEAAPKQFRNAQANANSSPKGSRFVVAGKLYDVKKVENAISKA